MPLTPAHAVIALPFVRTPLVPAAIAVGAMAPDLPLFLRGTGLRYAMTHDAAWIPVTMAIALALLLVWRCVLRPAAREVSPAWLAARLPHGWDDGARAGLRETFGGRVPGVLLLVVSLAIGVASHIAWDLFTHEDRWGVLALPVLDESWGPLPGYKWLQHASGALGLAVLGGWALVWLARRLPEPAERLLPSWARVGWWMSLPLLLAATWVWGLGVYGPLRAEWTPSHLAYLVLPPACAVWGAATLVLCGLVQIAQRQASARVGSSPHAQAGSGADSRTGTTTRPGCAPDLPTAGDSA